MDKSKSGTGLSGQSKPPRIVGHLQSCTVNDGQSVTLKCSVKCK